MPFRVNAAPSPIPPATTATVPTRRGWTLGIGVLCVAVLAVLFTRTHLFVSARSSEAAFRAAARSIAPLPIVLGLLSIFGGFGLRAVRWALLMPPERRPHARALFAPQIIGFAAVALFGRVADLTRPYLVARRTQTPVTVQIGVYSVERALDLAATAVLFSVTLLFVPRSAPHHEAFSRAGILASAATLFLLGFAWLLRFRGDRIAAFVHSRLPRLSPSFAQKAATRILELQAGFSTLRTLPQAAAAFALSMLIWIGIALSYLFTVHSLPAVPQLAILAIPSILLLMATSMGASLLQLPIAGWLTQIAALAAAIHGFFGVPPAAASLCAVLIFLVTTLSVIPAGLLMAHYSGLSLREARSAPTLREQTG